MCKSGKGTGQMRVVMFYSEVESFNFFTDQLAGEFTAKGHEVFILDSVNPLGSVGHSYGDFAQFLSGGVQGVICFDGWGLRDDFFIEIWNKYQAKAVDILMDHPLRFHPALERHPDNYYLFCCDQNHVEYVKKYFGSQVPFVEFMPHAGVLPPSGTPVIPFEKRKYDLLFTGTYYRPNDKFMELKQVFTENSDLYRFYQAMYEHFLKDSAVTTEQAVLDILEQFGWTVPDETLRNLLRCSEYVDWAIRMYQREQVVKVLADSGFELYLLGRGWENHPSIHCPNIHRIDDRIPYGQTLAYMADAKINLNVMPWFKAGTHDRIFNILLQHSLPLTDSSSWIDENFTDGVEIQLYDLKALDRLPHITRQLLSDPVRTWEMIEKGYEKAAEQFTWKQCAEQILRVFY